MTSWHKKQHQRFMSVWWLSPAQHRCPLPSPLSPSISMTLSTQLSLSPFPSTPAPISFSLYVSLPPLALCLFISVFPLPLPLSLPLYVSLPPTALFLWAGVMAASRWPCPLLLCCVNKTFTSDLWPAYRGQPSAPSTPNVKHVQYWCMNIL